MKRLLLGDNYQNHMTETNMKQFDSSDLYNYLLSSLLGTDKTKMLDDYWKNGNANEYSKLLVEVKSSGFKVYRNKEGKHIIKKE